MGHLVHRQTMELKFASLEDAQRWSPRLSELNQEIILPQLEKIFSTQVGDSQLLRIEQLEIDLGRLQESDLENDLASSIRRSLPEALQPYLPQTREICSDAPHLSIGGAAATESVEKLIDADSLRELLQLFLQTGRCPWWLPKELNTQLDWLYQRFWQLAPEAAQQLMQQTISVPGPLLRFVEQFSSRSHRLTLQRLAPSSAGDLLVDLHKQATRLLVRQGYGLQARTISLKLVYNLINVSGTEQFEQPQLLVRQFFASLLPWCLREAEKPFAQQASTASVAELLSLEREAVENRLSELSTESFEVVVDNAGILLLWPHLPDLFRKLSLLESPEGAHPRPTVEAVLLLQQLATGRSAGQENLLALNKLLCGIPLTVPVPRRRRRRRSTDWDAEVEALLLAVIGQWSALKNTSISGLRSSFLQRQGILREQGQGWSLQVERQAQDILLEQLPWGISMIQFSWMRQPLRVEW